MSDPIYNAINALDDIASGRKSADKKPLNENAKEDIGNMLKHFDNLTEGRATKEARQLPAEFAPKNISPVLGEPDKDHPTKGYFVGGESEYDSGSNDTREAAKNAIIGRIAMQHIDLLVTYGPEDVENAVDEVASDLGDLDEIGSSDVSAWVKEVENLLSYTNEDVVSKNTKNIGDYISDINSAEQGGVAREMQKKSVSSDTLSAAVKTLRTPDGKELKIHGNEDDGFRVSVGGKLANNRFSNLDEAAKACESYIKKGVKNKMNLRDMFENTEDGEETPKVATSDRMERILRQLRIRNPAAKNDLEALLYDFDRTHKKDRKDIKRLSTENETAEQTIKRIEAELEQLKSGTGIVTEGREKPKSRRR